MAVRRCTGGEVEAGCLNDNILGDADVVPKTNGAVSTYGDIDADNDAFAKGDVFGMLELTGPVAYAAEALVPYLGGKSHSSPQPGEPKRDPLEKEN